MSITVSRRQRPSPPLSACAKAFDDRHLHPGGQPVRPMGKVHQRDQPDRAGVGQASRMSMRRSGARQSRVEHPHWR